MRYTEITTKLTDQSDKDKRIENFEKLFLTSQTIKQTDTIIQLKPGHSLIKQKTRPKPYHWQSYVQREIFNFFSFRAIGKNKKNRKRLLRISDSNNCEKGHISQKCMGFKEIKG